MATNDSTGLPPRVKDERGNVYGKLTVLEFAYLEGTGIRWLCSCECGKNVIVRGSSLRNGHTSSCGCAVRVRMASAKLRNTAFGMP